MEAHGQVCGTDPCTTCESIATGLESVAQALINIGEGLTTIEPGSRLFDGMNRLMSPDVANIMRAAPFLLAAAQEWAKETACAVSPTKTAPVRGCDCWTCERVMMTRAAIAKAVGK